MAEPAPDAPDSVEAAVDQAIAIYDGDVRATLRAPLGYNDFLERKLETMRGMVSSGYTRGKISPEFRNIPRVGEFSKKRYFVMASYLQQKAERCRNAAAEYKLRGEQEASCPEREFYFELHRYWLRSATVCEEEAQVRRRGDAASASKPI